MSGRWIIIIHCFRHISASLVQVLTDDLYLAVKILPKSIGYFIWRTHVRQLWAILSSNECMHQSKNRFAAISLLFNFVLKIHGISRIQISLNFEQIWVVYTFIFFLYVCVFAERALCHSFMSDSNNFADNGAYLFSKRERVVWYMSARELQSLSVWVQDKRGRQYITLKSIIMDTFLFYKVDLLQRLRWFLTVQFHMHPTMVWHHGTYSSGRHQVTWYRTNDMWAICNRHQGEGHPLRTQDSPFPSRGGGPWWVILSKEGVGDHDESSFRRRGEGPWFVILSKGVCPKGGGSTNHSQGEGWGERVPLQNTIFPRTVLISKNWPRSVNPTTYDPLLPRWRNGYCLLIGSFSIACDQNTLTMSYIYWL